MSAKANADKQRKTAKGKRIVKVKDLPVTKKAPSMKGGVSAAEPGDPAVIVGLNKRS